jgi:macrophage erythroblast attacher
MTLTLVQQVPYENYRKVFRASQRHIEKEFGAVQSSSSDLAQRFKSGNLSSEDAGQAIDAMINRVETLQKKVSVQPGPVSVVL